MSIIAVLLCNMWIPILFSYMVYYWLQNDAFHQTYVIDIDFLMEEWGVKNSEPFSS